MLVLSGIGLAGELLLDVIRACVNLIVDTGPPGQSTTVPPPKCQDPSSGCALRPCRRHDARLVLEYVRTPTYGRYVDRASTYLTLRVRGSATAPQAAPMHAPLLPSRPPPPPLTQHGGDDRRVEGRCSFVQDSKEGVWLLAVPHAMLSILDNVSSTVVLRPGSRVSCRRSCPPRWLHGRIAPSPSQYGLVSTYYKIVIGLVCLQNTFSSNLKYVFVQYLFFLILPFHKFT
jgi:hypothetical protein